MNATSIGRPTKLTESVLDAFRKALDHYEYCTDEQLLECLNMELPESHQVGHRTFKRWKSASADAEDPGQALAVFRDLYLKARIRQKQQLLKSLQDNSKGWQRYAWILERKFSEWNIKRRTAGLLAPVKKGNHQHSASY